MAYEVRPYQQEAIAFCLAAFADKGRESVLLESPVGSGKTYMALEAIHRFQERVGRRLKIGWVAPRHRLLQQMMEANTHLYKDDIRPVSLFERFPPEVDFVVLDEAHHEATQSCVLLYEKMKPSWTLGLSATPLRTDRMKLSFQETVQTCSIARLIREGYLSPFNSYLITDFSVANVAAHYLASPERWGKSLVFFSTIAECIAFRERLAADGVACEVVTSDSDKDLQMELFESGRVPVIANVAMLTEGFDQPDVQSVFVRDASRLPVIQMAGRGLRRAEGKSACNIVQSANSAFQFERVAAPKNAFRHQSGRWLALTDGTEEIERAVQETLRRLELRQKEDRKARRSDYLRAAREAPGRFTREIQRLDRAEKRADKYYRVFGEAYRALQSFLRQVDAACYENPLPPVILHFDKRSEPKGTAVSVDADFARLNGQPRPAIVLSLARAFGLKPRMLALTLLEGVVQLHRLHEGKHVFSPDELKRELDRLGYLVDRKSYRSDSPVARILRLADEQLTTMPALLRSAYFDAFTATKTGDVKFFEQAPVGPLL